jgi:hypothetical protein
MQMKQVLALFILAVLSLLSAHPAFAAIGCTLRARNKMTCI